MTIDPDLIALRHDLAKVLNRHGIDSDLNTSDTMLAWWLVEQLTSLSWWLDGREDRIW